MAAGPTALRCPVRRTPHGHLQGSGTFAKVGGTVQYGSTDPARSSIDLTIDAASVDSRVAMRHDDLRSAKLLDVTKYPTINFKSKQVETLGEGKLKVTGDLRIHGATKEVVLEVEGPSTPIRDPQGNSRIGLQPPQESTDGILA